MVGEFIVVFECLKAMLVFFWLKIHKASEKFEQKSPHSIFLSGKGKIHLQIRSISVEDVFAPGIRRSTSNPTSQCLFIRFHSLGTSFLTKTCV